MDRAVIRSAGQRAETALAAAGITITEAATLAQLRQVREVFDTVWQADPTNPAATVELLSAYVHTGQFVVLAADAAGGPDGEVVAASMGFLCRPVGRGLHSNVTGVLPAALGRSVGTAVKWYQRAWSLRQGLDLVTWTYDPLIRRNAWLNLGKLGALPVAYWPNCYGAMADGRNSGDESDRLYVHWELAGPRVVAAAAGQAVVPELAALHRNGFRELVRSGPGEEPVVAAGDAAAPGALVQVPRDIEAIRAADPALARAWRLAVRAALLPAVEAGWAVTGFTPDGWYVLQAPGGYPDATSGGAA